MKLVYDDVYPNLKPFTIHILNNPRVASYVRNFTLEEDWREERDDADDRAVDEAVLEAVN